MPEPSLSTIHHPADSQTGCPAFTMVKVEGGSFLLDDKIKTSLSSFYMGQHPVTQALWEAVMGKNPGSFKGGNRPVETVSWYDCVTFCNRLSEMQGLEAAYEIDQNQIDSNNRSENDDQKWLVIANPQATGYRLPTEAEWEYVAKGGIYSQGYEYAGSDELDRVGWYEQTSYRKGFSEGTQPVGMKLPNELGLYDMSGNVWEWCWDWYGLYMDAYMENPTGHISGKYRVLRGGSWVDDPSGCRVASRDLDWPSYRSVSIGFRLSRTAL